MGRQLRAEDVADIMDEPDWDDSDASSDEDDEYSPLGLRTPFGEWKTVKTQNTVLAIHSRQSTLALSLLRSLNNHARVTQLPLPVLRPRVLFRTYTLYVSLLACNILYRSMTTHLNNVHYVYHMYKI